MKRNICKKCIYKNIDKENPPCALCLDAVNFPGFEENEVPELKFWEELNNKRRNKL